MITNWWITGDCHGEFTRFYKLNQAAAEDNEIWGVIALGDFGANYWLTKSELKKQKQVCHSYPNLRFYCVRGNHEQRPNLVEGMTSGYDDDVSNIVYYHPEVPNIKYLIDGTTYIFSGFQALILGGAYSIDKEYRLERAAAGGYAGWFPGEQLTEVEMKRIEALHSNEHFDLVLSHTCPISWEPRDLFLSFVDQSKVDKSMELWMEEFKGKIIFGKWFFGHFHDDRIINNKARMFYQCILPLEEIV